MIVTVTSEDLMSATQTYTLTVTRSTARPTGGFKYIEAGWSYRLRHPHRRYLGLLELPTSHLKWIIMQGGDMEKT